MFMHNQCIHKLVLVLLISMSGQIHNTISLTKYFSFRHVCACVRLCGRAGVHAMLCVCAWVRAIRACGAGVQTGVHVGERAYVRAYVRARERACVRCACVRVCVRACVRACARDCLSASVRA